jgi:hypothetical protein
VPGVCNSSKLISRAVSWGEQKPLGELPPWAALGELMLTGGELPPWAALVKPLLTGAPAAFELGPQALARALVGFGTVGFGAEGWGVTAAAATDDSEPPVAAGRQP